MKCFTQSWGNALTVAAVLVLFGLTGCDAVTSPDAGSTPPINKSSKMRHAHLFGQNDGAGKIINRYEDLVTETEFIVAVAETVLDMSRVLDRYEQEEGATIKRSYRRAFKGFAMHVDNAQVPHLLDLLDADDDIAWVEPDPKISLTQSKQGKELDTKQRTPWGVQKSGGSRSSTNSGNGNGSVNADIYILDSGASNEDLNVVENVSFVPGDPIAIDVLGHGTHVASTAAAIDDHNGVVGIAPGARVHNLKVLDDFGQAELSTAIAAVEYVTEQKAANPSVPMVVNISFGADVGTTAYNALDLAIAESIKQGVIYVIAAGNEGIDAATVTPAHVAEAITVGAYDVHVKFAAFSNYGPTVDMHAPGESVQGLQPNALIMEKMSGTSMAAPHVAGAVALYLSQNPAATPQHVLQALFDAGDARGIKGSTPQGTTKMTLDVSDF